MSPIYDMDAVNNAPERRVKPAGLYHAEISEVVDAPSKAGNAMLTLQFIDVQDGWKLCKDRIMLGFVEGYDPKKAESALGMAKSRLKALGIPLDKPLDPQSLRGLRCWLAIKYGKPNEEGKSYMEVDTSAKGSKVGYYPDGEHPLADPSQAASIFGNQSKNDDDEPAPF